MDIEEEIVRMAEEELFYTLKCIKGATTRGEKEEYSRIILNLSKALKYLQS